MAAGCAVVAVGGSGVSVAAAGEPEDEAGLVAALGVSPAADPAAAEAVALEKGCGHEALDHAAEAGGTEEAVCRAASGETSAGLFAASAVVGGCARGWFCPDGDASEAATVAVDNIVPIDAVAEFVAGEVAAVAGVVVVVVAAVVGAAMVGAPFCTAVGRESACAPAAVTEEGNADAVPGVEETAGKSTAETNPLAPGAVISSSVPSKGVAAALRGSYGCRRGLPELVAAVADGVPGSASDPAAATERESAAGCARASCEEAQGN